VTAWVTWPYPVTTVTRHPDFAGAALVEELDVLDLVGGQDRDLAQAGLVWA
jgi:hypothetical protein